jgi:hypothetical protein
MDEKRAIDMKMSGSTYDDIAAVFGTYSMAVYRVVVGEALRLSLDMGWTPRQIAEGLRIGLDTVEGVLGERRRKRKTKWLRIRADREGTPTPADEAPPRRRRTGIRLDETQREALLAAVASGKPYRAVAAHLGVSVSMVRRVVVGRAIGLSCEGLGVADIAEMVGLPVANIERILEKESANG